MVCSYYGFYQAIACTKRGAPRWRQCADDTICCFHEVKHGRADQVQSQMCHWRTSRSPYALSALQASSESLLLALSAIFEFDVLSSDGAVGDLYQLENFKSRNFCHQRHVLGSGKTSKLASETKLVGMGRSDEQISAF